MSLVGAGPPEKHRHRDIDQRSPDTTDDPAPEVVPIEKIRQPRILDGLINDYHRAA